MLGVVGVPALGELFGGIVGGGAWKRDGAGERPIRARTPPPEGLTVLASRHYANDARLAPSWRTAGGAVANSARR